MSTETTERPLIDRLDDCVSRFYWDLFRNGCGGEFHAFVEWCGVMKEHLNICRSLQKAGIDPFYMNVHTGAPLPIPGYQLAYLAEKIDCIFAGALTVSPSSPKAESSPAETQET